MEGPGASRGHQEAGDLAGEGSAGLPEKVKFGMQCELGASKLLIRAKHSVPGRRNRK